MTYIRRLILAVALSAGLAPAFAQAPPPVPALPDSERRTSYAISASLCGCAVGFQLYADSTDVANWLEVYVNGVRMAQPGNWTITSPSGSLATLPRPITDAVLNFTLAQTGTIQIVGARRPRRTTQFQESAGVSARNLNQTFSDVIATMRETWDRTNDFTGRAVLAPPGETLALLPVLANRANMGACFNSGGDLTSCVAASVGSGTFAAGANILFTGTNPTTISATNSAVPDITALKALNTASITNVFLTAPGRAGNFLWTLGNFTAHVAADTNNGIYVKANAISAATGAWVRVFNFNNYSASWFGVTADCVTSNTTILNTALATMAAYNPNVAGVLDVERCVQFSSTGLNFGSVVDQTHAYISFLANSNATQGVPTGGGGTSERRLLSVNSGYPNNVNGGYVGEHTVLESPLNPAMITNIANNLTGLTTYLNVPSGQAIIPTGTNAIRSSWIMNDNNTEKFYAVYQTLLGNQNQNAVQIGTVSHRVALTNVGSTAGMWPVGHFPVANDIVTGLTSGALGYVISITPTVLNVVWQWGTYQVGETIRDATTGFNSTTTVTVVGDANFTNNPLWFGTDTNRISIDVDPGSTQGAFTVAGRATFQPSVNIGSNPLEVVANPAAMWCQGIGDPTACLQIVYSVSPAKANRILELRKGNAQTDPIVGQVGGNFVHTSFTDAASPTIPSSSYNVSLITRTGTGAYQLSLINAAINTSFQCIAQSTSVTDDARAAINPSTTAVNITNFNFVSRAAANAAGTISVICQGGER